ncbi:MAG TPA: hypothetical protein VNO81_10010 [Candidatus Nitrosotenuis sp.]|nr:hypothetical protein [Candidatus Nitrosotenuis sp.]
MMQPVQRADQAPAVRRPRDPNPQPPPAAEVEFSYNPQDVMVMPPQPARVKAVEPGPRAPKAELKGESLEPVDGRYVYPQGDPRLVSAQAFSAVARTIEIFEQALGQPVGWAFSSPRLGVVGDDGEDFNAYYSRDMESVHFFHGTDPITGQKVYSGASGEVVSHEAGHAILDGLRPGYFSSWTPDVGAFHESFGDMMGMLVALQDDRVVGRVAVQTGGDLSRPNVVAALGEELGIAINDYLGENATGGDFVRNAINDFVKDDPRLGSEPHDLSRLWTGAFYEVLSGICKQKVDGGMDVRRAIKETGAEGLRLLANLMKEAPQGDFTFTDMARAFVESDRLHNGGARADLIRSVMVKRGLLEATPSPEPPPAPEPPPSDEGGRSSGIFTSTSEGRKPLDDVTRTLRVRLSGPEFGIFNGAVAETVVDKDGSLSKDTQVRTRTQESLKRLIVEGRIRYNDPNYRMKFPQDYFDPQGRPYVGAVRWENGQMIIERLKFAQ